MNQHIYSEHFTTSDVAVFELFNSALYDGMCYYDKSNVESIEVGDNLKNILGYQLDQKLGWDDLLHPEDLKKFQTTLHSVLQNQETALAQKLRVLLQSGDTLLMECQVYCKSTAESTNHFVFIGFKNSTKIKFVVKETLERQKRNDEILDGTAIGTWQYNVISEEILWNESLSTIIGYKPEEIKGSKCDFWQKLTYPEDSAKSKQLFYEHINTKSSCFRNEIRMLHKDGNWIWVAIIGKVLNYNRSNRPEWMGGVIYDITDRKNGELLALKYEDLLRRVNQAAEIGIWEVDLATRKMPCSDELKNMFGVPLDFEPTLDDAIGFIKKGKDRQKLINSIQNATEKGQNYDIEVEAMSPSGVPFLVRAIGLSEFSNGRCSRFYGFVQNINQKALANNELAIKEELFRKTFLYAPFGMAITNLDGNISQLNKNIGDFFGYKKEELLQTKISQFSHPQDADLSNDYIRQLLIDKSESIKLDKRYIHRDGSTIWAQVSVSSIKNQKGKITNFVVQLQDITERKRDELLLINYKDLLDRSNHIAKIGSWEIDVNNHTVSWSDSLSSILNTRENVTPKFEDSISHFTSAEHKVNIESAIQNALQFGNNFDEQILVKVGDGEFKWVRMLGISEFADNQCKRLYGLVQDIDLIKKAQIEVSNKEEQWRTTFDHANAGIALINFDGVVYKVNQSMCDIFGYTIEEMQLIRIKNISLPEDLDENIELMSNLINGKSSSFCKERQFVNKDKNIIWTNITVSAVKNDFNELTHMVAQVIDITASKTNELLLKKYKKILERSNDVAKIGSWELDPTSQELFWSENLSRLLGTSDFNGGPIDESIINYILEEDRQYMSDLLKDAINNGTNYDIEILLKTATGTRWMRVIAISDYENGTCKLLHGLVQDIHEFKSAQLDVLLREEEFRQTFWYAPIGMALLDLKGTILRINPTMCDTFGFTEKEMLELDKKIISHPEDAIITGDLVKKLLNEESESFQQERRYYNKNKKLIWGILSMSAVKNDKGVISHFVMLVNDITDKKLLTENLTEHNDRLQNYAHIVSHNLRSHTGNLAMLLELSEIDDKQRIDEELFEHIKAASANMNETVSHLSEIVEIQNLIKNTLVPQNLQKRIKKALENVQATLSQINGKVSIKVNEDFMVYAIPSYLDSILLNMLTNAIKYRSPNQPLLIKIAAENSNGRTSLSFTDNGLGIDLERYGTKIFGMYKTFHDHKNAKGIGLFMTKNQLEAMGGGIEVISKPNVGSTFTIYFKDENS